LIKITKKN